MEKIKGTDEYIRYHDNWKDELLKLRGILNQVELEEAIKWGIPTYISSGKNILGFAAFKDFVSLWFFQGVFLKDEAGKLINTQEEKTKAQRQWRFKTLQEINDNEDLIKLYIEEALQNHKDGKVVKVDRNKAIVIPPELNEELKLNDDLFNHFDALSKSRKREFCDYINDAKQNETKIKRLQKIIPMILDGVGLNDKYR